MGQSSAVVNEFFDDGLEECDLSRRAGSGRRTQCPTRKEGHRRRRPLGSRQPPLLERPVPPVPVDGHREREPTALYCSLDASDIERVIAPRPRMKHTGDCQSFRRVLLMQCTKGRRAARTERTGVGSPTSGLSERFAAAPLRRRAIPAPDCSQTTCRVGPERPFRVECGRASAGYRGALSRQLRESWNRPFRL